MAPREVSTPSGFFLLRPWWMAAGSSTGGGRRSRCRGRRSCRWLTFATLFLPSERWNCEEEVFPYFRLRVFLDIFETGNREELLLRWPSSFYGLDGWPWLPLNARRSWSRSRGRRRRCGSTFLVMRLSPYGRWSCELSPVIFLWRPGRLIVVTSTDGGRRSRSEERWLFVATSQWRHFSLHYERWNCCRRSISCDCSRPSVFFWWVVYHRACDTVMSSIHICCSDLRNW